MNEEEFGSTEHGPTDRGSTDERVDAIVGLLPDSVRGMAEAGVKWVREHPVEAAVAGAAGGFLVGAVGVGRAWTAARWLRGFPKLVPGVLAGAAAVAQHFDAKARADRVTH